MRLGPQTLPPLLSRADDMLFVKGFPRFEHAISQLHECSHGRANHDQFRLPALKQSKASVMTSSLCGGADGTPETPKNTKISVRSSALRLSSVVLSTNSRRLVRLARCARLPTSAAEPSAPH
jgi:hypothetical protein